MLRMARAGVMVLVKDLYDYSYIEQQGWLASDYYYDTRLGLLKSWQGVLGYRLMKQS